MAVRTTADRVRAELEQDRATSPLGEVLAVWAALADAFWLGTLRAVLAPEPQAAPSLPAPGATAVSARDAATKRAA